VLATTLAAAGGTQSTAKDSNTYTWFGELVSFDKTALTVKARVAYPEAVAELKRFKPGERVWVTWSGVLDYSDAVRQIRQVEPGQNIDENLVLPAELVSTEAANQYVTLRITVPESSAAAIRAVKPGEWLTVTSRHRPASESDAIVAVAPYGSTENVD
jgi:hypothetical protein